MCDRILVFSSNPGRIVAEIKVDLPQPRNRLHPAFRRMVDDIYARMTQRPTSADDKSRDGLFPGMGIGMVLPRVSTNIMAGLIEAVSGPAFGGQAHLPDLATALQYEADELFPIAEVLQLLRLAELDGGDLRLTSAARKYADADVDGRKQLFAQHLISYVPLANHIRRVLNERSSHQAPAGRFRDELEDLMSEKDADQTLKAVINWARYGEAFAYDEGADLFSLDDPA